MDNLKDKKTNVNNNDESSADPNMEEDDFFTRWDRMHGVADDQLAKKEEEQKEKEPDVDLEITKAFQTLNEEDQEVFSRTKLIHVVPDEPVETQMMKVIELQKKNDERRHKIFKIILGLMIAGTAISLIGIFANSYVKNRSSASAATENPLAVSSSAADITINEVTFPDSVFRKYIQEQADKNGDGNLSASERNSFLIISIQNETSLTNMKGIELFPLLQAVNITSSSVTELDLSSNTLIENLNISGTKITSLDLSGSANISSLNIDNTPLTEIVLPAPSKIDTIDYENTSLECYKDDEGHYTGCKLKE